MPITKRQFELGIDSDLEERMQRIYSFMEAHPDEAFSLAELREIFKIPDSPKDYEYGKAAEWVTDNERFLMSLERLVKLDIVRERDVASIKYYATGRFTLTEILNS